MNKSPNYWPIIFSAISVCIALGTVIYKQAEINTNVTQIASDVQEVKASIKGIPAIYERLAALERIVFGKKGETDEY